MVGTLRRYACGVGFCDSRDVAVLSGRASGKSAGGCCLWKGYHRHGCSGLSRSRPPSCEWASVPPRNAGALADAVAMLLENEELRHALGRRGREIVVKEFSVTAVTGQTLALYCELLHK
jgi:hypothetical protein